MSRAKSRKNLKVLLLNNALVRKIEKKEKKLHLHWKHCIQGSFIKLIYKNEMNPENCRCWNNILKNDIIL